MNRLIIIGNGFDLAHGMKTTFSDFIADYLARAITMLISNRGYSDLLLQIELTEYDFYELQQLNSELQQNNVFGVIEHLQRSEKYSFQFKSILLDRLYAKCSELLWVDIETEYFNVLISTKNDSQNYNQIDAIRSVNLQLEYLKKELVQYLDIQQQGCSNMFDLDPLIKCFCGEIKDYEVVTTHLTTSQVPEHLYFLNFNYTNTFERYVDICNPTIPSDFNYIHGSLSNIHGKPIFGFGDEFDRKYLEFEDEKNNELFKHIKSFEYLQTKNFYLLTRFVESDNFQVHIYGHSCGLSDRTMLNQIFEHENCKSIKIYYHKIDDNTNDFTDKTYEISRHFRNKTSLRKKLVPFDLSKEMPQPKNRV